MGDFEKEFQQKIAIDRDQVATDVFAKSKAVSCVEKYLGLRLKRYLKHWRGETDAYLNDVKFRLRHSKLQI